ncbi:hypothetical protein AAH446_06785 [Erwinia sp. P6884]|uniref:hypothetical protein n=1 Tax=Erwinia sp. P6884 TaxID=3141450 RepID=UPI0031913BB1
MAEIPQISRSSAIKKALISILTPSFIIIAISTLFIWIYLYRIGRQDIFLQAISFNEILNFVAFYSIISILIFCIVFYIPSIIPPLILHTELKNYSDYKKIERGYTLALILSSFIAAALFWGGMYYFKKVEMPVENGPVVPIFFIINIIACVALTYSFNKKIVSYRSGILSGRDKIAFITIINFFKPALLGLVSCSFVFPLGLIMKTLKFPDGTGNLKEAIWLFSLTSLIIILTLIPLMVFSGLRAGLLKRLTAFFFSTLITLALTSSLLPVIPAMIINMTMKLSGVMDLTMYCYAVPAEKYPAEMFAGKRWGYSESKDKKFHIFEGVNLFTLGNVSLICPKNTPEILNESMHYQLGDKEFDNRLRKKLQQSTKKCIILNKDTLLKWQQ